VRPEAVKLAPNEDGNARVLVVSFLGSLCRVQVAAQDGTLVVAQTSAQEAGGLRPGTSVMVTFLDTPAFATRA
jgi:putative spermidine/putrescine transport system ATP-binding protein